MTLDPFSLLSTVQEQQRRGVEELRPSVDLASAGFRITDISASALSEASPVSSTGRDVRELPQSPADPRFRYRIPQPACSKCGRDHHPNKSYDHSWQGDQTEETAAPMTSYTESAANGLASPAASAQRRVAVYVGRGDAFVLKVEENPPDWDDVYTRKMSREQVLLVLPVLRVLGIKIKDLTGGELDDDQLAEDRPRAAASAGTRRSAEEAAREYRELLGEDPPTLGTAGGSGGDGDGADGQSNARDRGARDAAEDQE